MRITVLPRVIFRACGESAGRDTHHKARKAACSCVVTHLADDLEWQAPAATNGQTALLMKYGGHDAPAILAELPQLDEGAADENGAKHVGAVVNECVGDLPGRDL
jgi:hypothetical protein